MRHTIKIAQEAYDLLASLKIDKRDSFTKVILRHVGNPDEIADVDKFVTRHGRRSKRV